MEFKHEELIEREITIAGYLVQDLSLKYISGKTGLSKKIVTAHIKNMMTKLNAEDRSTLVKLLKSKPD